MLQSSAGQLSGGKQQQPAAIASEKQQTRRTSLLSTSRWRALCFVARQNTLDWIRPHAMRFLLV
jgi:hypothetical protein